MGGKKEWHISRKCGIRCLIKNIPNKSEMWKAPVKDWIHDVYGKRQRKSCRKAKRKAVQQNKNISHSI